MPSNSHLTGDVFASSKSAFSAFKAFAGGGMLANTNLTYVRLRPGATGGVGRRGAARLRAAPHAAGRAALCAAAADRQLRLKPLAAHPPGAGRPGRRQVGRRPDGGGRHRRHRRPDRRRGGDQLHHPDDGARLAPRGRGGRAQGAGRPAARPHRCSSWARLALRRRRPGDRAWRWPRSRCRRSTRCCSRQIVLRLSGRSRAGRGDPGRGGRRWSGGRRLSGPGAVRVPPGRRAEGRTARGRRRRRACGRRWW